MRILYLTVAITCSEVIFEFGFFSCNFLSWNLVCAYHSHLEDYRVYIGVQKACM